LRVVCGIGETIETGSWQAVFKNVDFPAEGLPIITTSAVFCGLVLLSMFVFSEFMF
jgi:hypothetical protein